MIRVYKEVFEDGYCEHCLESYALEYIVRPMEFAIFNAENREKAKMQHDAGESITGGSSSARAYLIEPIKRVDIFYAHPNL